MSNRRINQLGQVSLSSMIVPPSFLMAGGVVVFLSKGISAWRTIRASVSGHESMNWKETTQKRLYCCWFERTIGIFCLPNKNTNFYGILYSPILRVSIGIPILIKKSMLGKSSLVYVWATFKILMASNIIIRDYFVLNTVVHLNEKIKIKIHIMECGRLVKAFGGLLLNKYHILVPPYPLISLRSTSFSK